MYKMVFDSKKSVNETAIEVIIIIEKIYFENPCGNFERLEKPVSTSCR